jgi:hypothetical protein
MGEESLHWGHHLRAHRQLGGRSQRVLDQLAFRASPSAGRVELQLFSIFRGFRAVF